MHDLVQLYLTLAPQRMASVRTSVMLGDLRQAEAAAHALGSSCGQLGAMRMQRMCIRIERRAGEGQADGLASLAAELEDEFRRVRAWLDEQTADLERVA